MVCHTTLLFSLCSIRRRHPWLVAIAFGKRMLRNRQLNRQVYDVVMCLELVSRELNKIVVNVHGVAHAGPHRTTHRHGCRSSATVVSILDRDSVFSWVLM